MPPDYYADMWRAMIFKGSYIEITNRCNLDCRDCYNSSGRNKQTVELDLDVLLKYVEDLIVIHSVRSVTFSGGEPLLYSKIDELLDRLAEYTTKYPRVIFNFVTNGTLYNEKFYYLLENSDRFMVQISLDGPNEESCASMRGVGTFTKVLDNISRRKFFHKPVFKMIINKTNASFVEEYFHFAYDKLGGLPSFAFANYQGNAIQNWKEMELLPSEKAKILTLVQKKYKEYNITDVTLPVATVHCDLTDFEGLRDFCIKPDGSVQPCQNLYDSKFSIGNIYELDWKSFNDKISKLVEYLALRMEQDYGCKKCLLSSNCGRGCPAFAFMKDGNLLGNDGDCDFRRMGTISMIKAEKCQK